MALVEIREIAPDVKLGLWKIDESVDELFSQNPYLQSYESVLKNRYHNDNRKKEFLAIHALLYAMLGGNHLQEIEHLPSGKPVMNGYHLSISHTKGYAVLILSVSHEVAVDIEYMSNRVERIASKFMRTDEYASDVVHLLLHWSAKETIYKLFSEEQLQYHEMRLFSFSEDSCMVENVKSQKYQPVIFEVTSDYVLTYAIA